jgi:hypothetical protein
MDPKSAVLAAALSLEPQPLDLVTIRVAAIRRVLPAIMPPLSSCASCRSAIASHATRSSPSRRNAVTRVRVTARAHDQFQPQVCKQYGKQLIFVDASFQLNPARKPVSSVRTAPGKTTLFRMIVGEEHRLTTATCPCRRSMTIGYFRQDIEEMSGRSVLDEAIAGSGRLGDLHHELEALQHARWARFIRARAR